LKIKIHIEVLPNVEIDSKYKNISLKKEDIKVEDSEVNNAISEIERKFTKFEETNDKKVKAEL
jgi:FKBP-type peptidyl-prolyl cis-trans isomerase (trigger factor)